MIKKLLVLCVSTAVCAASIANDKWLEYYKINKVDIPKTVDHQIGGLEILKDGRVAAAFHSGEVLIHDPKNGEWHTYATGLQEPLGLLQDSKGILVTQLSELTRLIDENGDGVADYYQNVSDEFGMTGNYHEFVFGPARDKEGNLYISLNVASNYAGIFEHLRGEFSPIGLSREIMTGWRDPAWKELRHKAGRMFSKVPYRGWVLQITPEGKTIPFASGFRSPDGLFVDDKNRLWVTDNQGDWIGTSPLYHVEKGNFYGHPASLVWKENWQKDPLNLSADVLAKMKTPAVAKFPQGELANSPTQPVATVSQELFGLPEGELLIGDMNQTKLIRFLEDNVAGVTQGTLIPFLDTSALGNGNHRVRFDQEGNLWLGKTHLGWAGDEGIRKISWLKNAFLIADKVKQISNGFTIHFNQPIKQQLPEVTVTKHTYHYHAKYGSEKVDVQTLPVKTHWLDSSQKTLMLSLGELSENYLYTIEFTSLESQTNQPLMGDILRYNLVKKM
jgi:hypothetical protein